MPLTNAVLAIFVGVFVTNSALAQCHDCVSSPADHSPITLAKDWDAILGSGEFLLPAQSHFNLNRSETENLKLWSQYQNQVRALNCDSTPWTPRLLVDFQVTAYPMRKQEELTVADSSMLLAEKSVHQFLKSWVESSANINYEAIYNTCKGTSDFERCFSERLYAAKQDALRSVRTQVNAMSDEDLIRQIESSSTSPLSSDQTSFLAAIAVYRTLLAPASKDAFDRLETYRDRLNTFDKIFIAQRLGSYFGDAYDYERSAGKGPTVGRAVEADQIFGASMLNALIGEKDVGSDNAGKRILQPVTAGVCRDIAAAQGQVLKALGMKDTYVIEGISPGGPHAWLYTQDPDDRSRTYILNYGSASTAIGQTGAAALFPSRLFGQEIGLRYNVNEPGGKTVYSSLTATALSALEGFEGIESAQELAPGYRSQSQYLAAATLDLSEGHELRLFSTENRLGTRSIGVGTVLRYGKDSIAPTKVTTGLQVRTTQHPLDDKMITSEEIFISFEQRLQTGQLVFDPASYSYVKAYASAGIQGLFGAVHNAREMGDPLFASPNGHLWTGIEAHTGKPGSPVQANASAKVELQVGVKDQRNELKTLMPFVNQGVIQTDVLWDLSNSPEGRRELEKNPLGQRFLTLKAAGILNAFGGTFTGEAQFQWDRHQVKADVQLPFNSEMPLFLEGSIPFASTTYRYSASSTWDVWGRLNSPLKKGFGPAQLDLGTSIRFGK